MPPVVRASAVTSITKAVVTASAVISITSAVVLEALISTAILSMSFELS